MADYKITCCSTVDIPKERLDSYGIVYGKYHYHIDGKTYNDDLYTTESPQDFFGKIKAGAMPTTSPVTVNEMCALFEPILADGYDILHIEFSSGLSTAWKVAQEARVTMMQKYSDRKIYVIDSLAASSGYGMLVDMAADYKARGMGIDELRGWLEESKLYIRHWFCTRNLMHLMHGGRISAAKAVMGTIFKLCPIMDVNDRGELILRKKTFGKNSEYKTLLSYMREEAQDGLRYGDRCYICHSMMEDKALLLKKMIENEFPKLKGKVEINPIGAAIGSHSGAGTVAVFFLSETKRTR